MMVFMYSFLELKWNSFNVFTATTEKATAAKASSVLYPSTKPFPKAVDVVRFVWPANSGDVCPYLNAPTTTQININPAKIGVKILPMLDKSDERLYAKKKATAK